MVYSKKFILNECAVSEVFGQVLMTFIVVILMASIGMFVFSEPRPSEVPHINIVEQFDPFNDTIVICNNGGESIPLRDLKLVLHSGSAEYVINGEELSVHLIEEYGDNGYWDLSEYISVNVLEVCGLDLENRDEDLDVLLIYTPSKKVIHSSLIPSAYLDDAIQSPNDRISEKDIPEEDIPEEDIPEEDIPEEDIPEEDIPEDGDEKSHVVVGDLWIPPQRLAFDNSESSKGNKGSAYLDDVQEIGGGFTTYYPDEDNSTYEYFEFGLNESVLRSFGVTFSGSYENLEISGAKIKILYEGHDGSFRWVKLQVWDQTEGTLYEYDLPEYKHNYGEEVLDLPHITNTEDLENLKVYILAKKNPGNSGNKYIHIDYLAVYIP
jgi:FlaG/FlaF family flagellin (archaellin)